MLLLSGCHKMIHIPKIYVVHETSDHTGPPCRCMHESPAFLPLFTIEGEVHQSGTYMTMLPCITMPFSRKKNHNQNSPCSSTVMFAKKTCNMCLLFCNYRHYTVTKMICSFAFQHCTISFLGLLGD